MVVILSGCSAPIPASTQQVDPISTVTATAVLRPSATPTPTEQEVQSDLCMEMAANEFIPAFFNDQLVQVVTSPNIPLRVLLTSDEKNVLILTQDGIFSTTRVDGKTRCIHSDQEYSYTSFAMDPVREQWVVTTYAGKILFFDTPAGYPVKEFSSRNSNWVPSGWNQVSQDGSLMVSSGYFTSIRLWDLGQGIDIMETLGNHAAISPDNSRLAVSGMDFLQWIDLESGEAVRTVVNEDTREPYLKFLLFDSSGKFLFTLSNSSEVLVWDVESGEVVRILNQGNECKYPCGWEVDSPRLTLSADGTRLLLSDPAGVIVWDTTTWDEVYNRYHYWDEPVTDATISNHGELLIVALQDGTIYLMNPDEEVDPE